MAFPGPGSIVSAARRLLLVVGISGLAGLLVAGLALPVAAGLGLVARESANGFSDLPADLDTTSPLPERSRILDADGNLIAMFYEENRVYRELDDIAEVMQQAVLAIEDRRFYEHGPIDFRGTARAFVTNLETDTISEGGSTLTQQFAKKLAEAQATTEEERRAVTETSYIRKLRELRVALGLEQEMSKDQILEGYLNLVYYGAGAHGVEAAARRYFSTSASDLTLTQAATLAGLVQQPVRFDPTNNPEAAQARRDVVLRRMADEGFISRAELTEALAVEIELDEQTRPNGCVGSSLAPFYCEYVYQELMRMEELGETEEERDQMVRQGGLTIRTTLDRDVQREAVRAVSDRVAPTDDSIAALASVEPGTGEIKAMTHSRGYGSGEGQTYLNYVADDEWGRGGGAQSGSTNKVWTLAAAIEQGIALNLSINSPNRMTLPVNSFEDCDGPIRGTTQWNVGNYSTRLSGLFDLRSGTEQSVNTFYAQLLQQTGVCDPARIATAAGYTTAAGAPFGTNPSNVLGTDLVSPLTMAEAYAMFAARGVHCESYAVTQVRDRNGETIFEAEPQCNRAMEEAYADAVNDVLKGVVDNGTGSRMRLNDGREIAGKTGTTDGAVSVWWIGYIPQLTTAVGVWDPRGAFDPATGQARSLHGRTFNGEVIPDACGGCIPGPIWKQLMDGISGDYERMTFVDPDPTIIQGAMTSVPDVRGRSQSDAENVLREAGFRAHVADEVPSNHPAGTVVSTQPGPSSQHPSGGSVGLVISSGQPPEPEPDDEDPDEPGDDPPGRERPGPPGQDDDNGNGDDEDD